MEVSKKSVRVGDKDVYNVHLVYSRVLGLQQSRNIDFAEVLKHELAPLPTSVFKDDGEMQIAATKSDLKRQLQVGVSARLVEKVVATVIDGCTLLWSALARERNS